MESSELMNSAGPMLRLDLSPEEVVQLAIILGARSAVGNFTELQYQIQRGVLPGTYIEILKHILEDRQLNSKNIFAPTWSSMPLYQCIQDHAEHLELAQFEPIKYIVTANYGKNKVHLWDTGNDFPVFDLGPGRLGRPVLYFDTYHDAWQAIAKYVSRIDPNSHGLSNLNVEEVTLEGQLHYEWQI